MFQIIYISLIRLCPFQLNILIMFQIWIIPLLLLVQTTQFCDNNLCKCINNTCQSCLTDFSYNHNNTCYACPYQCSTCTNSNICLSCNPSYYLHLGTCIICPDYCLTCTPICTHCINGYALMNQQCLPCKQYNALTCQTPDILISCKQGYWQNGNSCSPCRQFCLVCSSPSNCLQCQWGYEVLISFGSYCSSCGTGCKICSSGVCSTCLYNYQLINGTCKTINTNCNTIPYCSKCTIQNGLIICHSCYYSYYLQNQTCKLGASLLCQGGAIGTNYFQCIDNCIQFGYQLHIFSTGLMCIPSTWLGSKKQLYYNVYSPIFQQILYQSPIELIAYDSNLGSSTSNQLSFVIELTPYYKLGLYFKVVFVGVGGCALNQVFNLNDNYTDTQSYNFNTSISSNYQTHYFNFTTKVVKEHTLTIQLISNYNSTYSPIMGLSQLLIQVYPCSDNCRICYNAQLCIQCQHNYYATTDNQCVENCSGFIELYLPNGDASNYSSKYCVLECPLFFFTFQSGNQYTCKRCSGLCLSCLSENQCLTCITPYLYYQIDLSCVLQCPSTHYQISNSCTPCNAPCSTCTNSSICTTCSMGFYYEGKCQSSCPSGMFQNTTNNSCSPCNNKCTACFGTATYCLSCVAPYLLFESSCQINCSSNLYYATTITCQPCLSPCYQCSSSNHCLSCSIGYLINQQCVLSCPDGYFADPLDSTCKLCLSNCFTCLSSMICLSCSNLTYLYGYQCVSNCPLTTYMDNAICMSCLSPCSACLNDTYCITCNSGYLSSQQLGKCINLCQDGYYGDIITSTCLPCTNNCATCQNSPQICKSCLSGYLLQNQLCLTSCANGYFNLSGICISCSYPCLTCTINDYTCSSCSNSFILLNQTCLTQCPPMNYLDTNSCKLCEYPCLTCLSKTECQSCVSTSSTFYYQKQCLTTCPNATFADNFSLNCKQCLFPCQNCLSQETCLTCISGYLNPYTNQCQICTSTLFINQSSKQCQLCSLTIINCYSCISAIQCIQCQPNFVLINATCINQTTCATLSGYYINTQLQYCSVCTQLCLDCINQTYCLSCKYGYLLEGQCLMICPLQYYYDNQQCSSCSYPCLTCTNIYSCLSCNSSSPRNIYFANQSNCITINDCPTGFFIDASFGRLQCIKCNLPCESCTNSTYCLNCVIGINYKGSCKSFCPNGYYVNQTNQTYPFCELCSATCFKCMLNSNYCTACNSITYLKNHTCVPQCGQNYYLEQTVFQCFACIQPCANCSDVSTCNSCQNSSFILYYGQCLTSCPDGTYSNDTFCLDCPSTCLTCYKNGSNVVLCSKCSGTRFMSSLSVGVCSQTCTFNQYGDMLTRNCFSCINPCSSCENAIVCKSCIANYLFHQGQCLMIDRCPDESFLLGQACVDNCSQLWAEFETAKCVPDCVPLSLKIIKNNTKYCLLQCPSGYFIQNNYTCQICQGQLCDDLLSLQIQVKSIFNSLYVKVTFSKTINIQALSSNMMQINIQARIEGRLLGVNNIPFQISRVNLNAVWLKLSVNQSIYSSTIYLTFNDYYIFSEPFQSLTFSQFITSFDVYGEQDQSKGVALQHFAQTMSLIMLLLFAVNIVLNAGHLSYSVIDYYQLLFMILFLSIDYPPQLNHFLYGFRYSHYLFLPQIFRSTSNQDYTTNTPDKFGVIVPDVDFLKNTGHDFIIIFITIAVLVLCKGIELVFDCIQKWRNNKVADDGEGEGVKEEYCFIRGVRAIIARFKWNYFNDILYTIYFSIMLFAFSQLYDLQWNSQQTKDLISIILAFTFILIGFGLPLFLGYLLNKNQESLISTSLQKEKQDYQTKKMMEASQTHKSQQKQQKELTNPDKSSINSSNDKEGDTVQEYQILTDYKCFLSGVKLKVRLGFYHIPIKYLKKLIMAALLVYCSSYPSFVLGVAMMFYLINIIIAAVLKPYRLTFQQIIYPIFDGLYLILFLTICIMQLSILNLSKQKKLNASYLSIGLCVLLSVLLVIHNLVINTIQIIKFCCGIDYFSKYYQTEYVSTSELTQHHPEQNTANGLLKKVQNKQDQHQSQQNQSNFSGLDIYLKKESTAPKYLIKCAKPELRKQKQIKSQNNQINNSQLMKEQHSIRESNQGLSISGVSRPNQKRQSISSLFSEDNIKQKDLMRKLPVLQFKTIDFEAEEEESDS